MKKVMFPPNGYQVMTLRSVLKKSRLPLKKIDALCREDQVARNKYTVCELKGCGDSLVATGKFKPKELVGYFLGEIKKTKGGENYRYAYQISKDTIVDPEFSGNEMSRMPHLFSEYELDRFFEFSEGERERVAEANVKIEPVFFPGLAAPVLRVSAIKEIFPESPIGFSYGSCGLFDADIIILDTQARFMPASSFKVSGTMLRIMKQNSQESRDVIELDLSLDELKQNIEVKPLPLTLEQKVPQCLVTFNEIGLRGICSLTDAQQLLNPSIYSQLSFSSCEDGLSILFETLNQYDEEKLGSKQAYEYLRNLIKIVNLALIRFETSSENFYSEMFDLVTDGLTELIGFVGKQQHKMPKFPTERMDFLLALQDLFSKLDASDYIQQISEDFRPIIERFQSKLFQELSKPTAELIKTLLSIFLICHQETGMSKQKLSVLVRVGYYLMCGKDSPQKQSLQAMPVPSFFRTVLPSTVEVLREYDINLTPKQIATAVNKTCRALR